MRKVRIHILFILSCITAFSAAQEPREHWELSSPESGNKEYTARDYIRLSPGFRYSSQAGSSASFSARIDPFLLFPPAENTYADPGGTITNDPERGGVVGSIVGQFAVSPTGAAAYTIPIDCPSGINGMEPAISIVYNSQAGDGTLGLGWGLSGLSSITQGMQTIFSDNAVKALTWPCARNIYLTAIHYYHQPVHTEAMEQHTARKTSRTSKSNPQDRTGARIILYILM